jgi:hypothetical protein
MIRQSWRRHVAYWIAPNAVVGGLGLMYFFGSRWMQEFVAPARNREFGALENIQNLILIAVIVVAGAGMARKRTQIERVFLGLTVALAMFILLEEIDYGWHYVELWRGAPAPSGTFRNLHNIGKAHHYIHDFMMAATVPLFGLFALIGGRTHVAVVRYLSPHPLSVATLASMVVAGQAAQLLNRMVTTNRSLKGNLSEFEEVYLYYVLFLYICELVFFRSYQAGEVAVGPGASAPADPVTHSSPSRDPGGRPSP